MTALDPRRYWTDQLNDAFEFMQTVQSHQSNENGEAFGSMIAASSNAGVEVEFSPAKHVNGMDRQFYLRTGLIPLFLAAARDMNDRGWVMLVEDAFRDRCMQSKISFQTAVFDQILERCFWECQCNIVSAEFVFKRLAAMIAFCPAVGTHMSGSAIDISVLDRNTRTPIDRGAPYLEISEHTPMASPFISEEARNNRSEIANLMRRHGFVAYPWEFWHFNSGDVYAAYLTNDLQPAKYGPVDWDRASNSVTPIDDATKPLISLKEIQDAIDTAMKSRQIGTSGQNLAEGWHVNKKTARSWNQRIHSPETPS